MRRHLAAVLLAGLSLNVPMAATSQADDTAAPHGQKEWTLLVYLNGHNNLDSFGALNINQMEQVGSTKDINVVVQWASEAVATTKRLYVKKDNDPNTVTSPVVQDMGKVDMGDWRNVVEFVRWGVATTRPNTTSSTYGITAAAGTPFSSTARPWHSPITRFSAASARWTSAGMTTPATRSRRSNSARP